MERREVENRLTGERIVFTKTTADTGGASVAFDLFLRPSGAVDFEHFHARQAETFRVRRGVLSLRIDGQRRELRAGEELTIPPGTPHTLRNDTGEEIEIEVEYRPALRSEWWLLHFHAAEDHLGRELSLLEMAPHLASGVEIYPARPGRWLVRLTLALLAPVARLLGRDRVLIDAAEAWHRRRAGAS